MSERIKFKEDGSSEVMDHKRYHVPKSTAKVPFKFKEVVPLTDRDFTVSKEGLCVYDKVPWVESGVNDDGLVFPRFGRYMQIGVEHMLRYIHLYHLVKAGSTVLDVACGHAELGKLLYTERKACTYVGMDISEKKLKMAINLRWGRSPTMFIQRDLSHEMPFADDTFDFVVSSEFIEHIPKKHAINFLKESYRVLKKGGQILVTTPNGDWGEVDPVHIVEYNYQETLDMLTEAGFAIGERYGLKLRGNVRHWDKEFADNEHWAKMRRAFPPIWAKILFGVNHPDQCTYWSAIGIKD